jgi:RHS repeat-associated protein
VGSATTLYTYIRGTNRLASFANGGPSHLVGTNANGNITNIPPANSSTFATFAYNKANRLASVTGSPVAASFVYDAFGRRFSKTNPGANPTLYTYSQDGRLIEENDNGTITDYLYADGRPISVLQPGASTANKIDYILADRLGTPQLASNSTGSTVWSTTYQPYGTTGAVTGSITQNLRLLGQNADVETGFNYNLNRNYMPNLGRYLETDPIGLAGGLNTYGYADANPGIFTDKWGLSYANSWAQIGAITLGSVTSAASVIAALATGGSNILISPIEVGAATSLGGAIGYGLGSIADWLSSEEKDMSSDNGTSDIVSQASKQGSKPKNCPPGTIPVDQTGMTSDDVHRIKKGVGAGPNDWTGIAPNGDVITGDAKGNATNNGPATTYLPNK